MNTKGALRKILSNLHPNTILKPNLDSVWGGGVMGGAPVGGRWGQAWQSPPSEDTRVSCSPAGAQTATNQGVAGPWPQKSSHTPVTTSKGSSLAQARPPHRHPGPWSADGPQKRGQGLWCALSWGGEAEGTLAEYGALGGGL